MNTTTRRFPRTTAEAFPDSDRARQERARQAIAIELYRRRRSFRALLGEVAIVAFIVFALLAPVVWQLTRGPAS